VVDPDGLEYPIRELAMLPNPEIVRWFKGHQAFSCGLQIKPVRVCTQARERSALTDAIPFGPPSTVFLRVET
jgi:hypothetical protein